MKEPMSAIDEQGQILVRLTREWLDVRRPRRPLPQSSPRPALSEPGPDAEPDEVSRYGADPPWI